MNINKFAIEMHDIGRIEKLNHLTNLETFHDDVRKLTKNIHSDHSIKRWQCLSEIRHNELVLLKTLHTIEMVRPFYTGGNIYCYFGKAGNYWFDVSDCFEEVCILDASPFDENGEVTESAWQRELEDEHLVEYLEGKDADEFKIQMYRWIIDHKHEKDVMDGISIKDIEFDLNELLSK